MRIETLNSMVQMDGLSRVNPINGLSRVNPINGLSRVNLNAQYTLNNGFTLNGYELNEYLENCAMYSEYPTINGCMNFFGKKARARRQERRAGRQERRAQRKDERRSARMERQQGRQDARTQRAQLRTEALKDVAGSVSEGLRDVLPGGGEMVSGFVDDFTGGFGPGQDFADEKGLFGPPSLFKDPGKWFSSNRVPTWQKAGVVAGGVLLVDAVTGGNIVLKPLGLKKGKK